MPIPRFEEGPPQEIPTSLNKKYFGPEVHASQRELNNADRLLGGFMRKVNELHRRSPKEASELIKEIGEMRKRASETDFYEFLKARAALYNCVVEGLPQPERADPDPAFDRSKLGGDAPLTVPLAEHLQRIEEAARASVKTEEPMH